MRYQRKPDSQATRFLRLHPRITWWTRLQLIARPGVHHATAESFVFGDGSTLTILENEDGVTYETTTAVDS